MKRHLSVFIAAALAASLCAHDVKAEQNDANGYYGYDNEIVTFIVRTAGTPAAVVKSEMKKMSYSKAMAEAYAADAEEDLKEENTKILNTVAKELGADTSGSFVYTNLDSGFTITAHRGDLERILAADGVLDVCEDVPIEIHDEKTDNVETATAVNAVSEYKGQGTLIAIIDSGFYLSHKYYAAPGDTSKLKYSKSTAESMIADRLSGRGMWYSNKIPYTYDYYESSTSFSCINNDSEHGTHVAGIAAGKRTSQNGASGDGTAPEAQLALMACGIGERLISLAASKAALDDAAKLGADVVNMSFGTQYLDARAYSALSDSIKNARGEGMVVCVSAGNSSRGFKDKTPLAENPDYGVGGNYGNVLESFSVASADTSTKTPSEFTSWGFTEDMKLKPDVMGVGGSVLSSTNDGSYGYMSGTSMASPYLAGICASVKSYLNIAAPFGALPDDTNISELIQQMAASAAVPAENTAGVKYSPRQQGAGLADMSEALKTKVVLFDNEGRTSVSLRNVQSRIFEVTFKAHNYSDSDITFDRVSVDVITDNYTTLNGIKYVDGIKKLTASYKQNKVTVKAKTDTTVTITVTLNQNELDNNLKIFKNGFYIDGFIRLSNSSSSVRIPFSGFYGKSWGSVPIFDKTVYDDGGSTLIDESDGYNGTYLETTVDGTAEILGRHPVSKAYDKNYIIISPKNKDGYMDTLKLYYSIYRSSSGLETWIMRNGSAVNTNILYWGYTSKFYNNYYSYSGLAALRDSEYSVQLRGFFDDGKENTEQTLDIPVVIDNTAPEIRADFETDNTLSVEVFDEHYIRSVTVDYTDISGNKQQETVDCDCTDKGYVNVFTLDNPKPSTVSVTARDYAYNSGKVKVYNRYCGAVGNEKNVVWDYNDGVLTISGTGAMADYSSVSAAPWALYSSYIKTVSVKSGVTNIGAYSFFGCKVMTSVTIEDSVKSISLNAFSDCTKLEAITLGNGNSVYASVDGVLFNKDKTTLVLFPQGKTGAYTVPDGVTEIGTGAFSGCTKITGVTIPVSLTTVKADAFNGCSGLETVNYSGSKTEWGNVVIGLNNAPFKKAAFFCACIDYGSCGEKLQWTITNDYKLEITGSGTMTNYSLSSVPPWYGYRDSIAAVSISNSASSIGNYAFCGFGKITSVIIPSGVTSIGSNAFSDCAKLTAINAESGSSTYTSIAGVLFNKDKTTLMLFPKGKTGAYTVPAGVTEIGSYAFYGCSGITAITVLTGVKTIGNSAFYGCGGLNKVSYSGSEAEWKKINIGLNNEPLNKSVITYTCIDYGKCGESLTWMLTNDYKLEITGEGDMTDYTSERRVPWYGYRDKIAEVMIGDNITSIGGYAFYACSGLIAFPAMANVTAIGDYAFSYCGGIPSVITITDKVTSIGGYAFAGCALTTVKYSGTGEKWQSAVLRAEEPVPDTAVIYCTDAVFGNTNCGDNAKWELFNGILTVTGAGAMSNYSVSKPAPWSEYSDYIEQVSISGITTIGSRAFMMYGNIKGLTISGNITSIGSYAFYGCDALEEINCKDTGGNWKKALSGAKKPIPGNVIIYCTDAVFGNAKCGDNAYWELYNGVLTVSGAGEMSNYSVAAKTPWSEYSDYIKQVDVRGITHIGNRAFMMYENIKELTVSNGVTSIGSYAFWGCTGITSVDLPAGVKSIGRNAFDSETDIYYDGSGSEWSEISGYSRAGGGAIYVRTPEVSASNKDNSGNVIGAEESKTISGNAMGFVADIVSVRDNTSIGSGGIWSVTSGGITREFNVNLGSDITLEKNGAVRIALIVDGLYDKDAEAAFKPDNDNLYVVYME